MFQLSGVVREKLEVSESGGVGRRCFGRRGGLLCEQSGTDFIIARTGSERRGAQYSGGTDLNRPL